jgi:hypothetical protein
MREHQMKNIERKKNNKEETDMKFNVTAMSKHFAKLCWDCTSSNQVRTKMKTLMSPTIIWQGNRIKCMKTAMTNSCKLCMVEKLEIMKRYSTDRAKLINNNSDIFASCTCNAKFHTLKTVKQSDTDDGSCPEKSRIKERLSKQPRQKKKKIVSPPSPNTRCHSLDMDKRKIARPGKPDLIDTNVPGLPFREPSTIPSRLDLAILGTYFNNFGSC